MHFSHGIGVGRALLPPVLAVTHRHGLDERALLGIGMIDGEVARFLDCRKRKGPFIVLHMPVEKNSRSR
jgi:hypothetical protein